MADNSTEKCSDTSAFELSIDSIESLVLEETLPINPNKLELCVKNYVRHQLSKKCLADIYNMNNSASTYYINRHIRSHLLYNFVNYMYCEQCQTHTRVQSNKLMKKLCYLCSSKLFPKEVDLIFVPICQQLVQSVKYNYVDIKNYLDGSTYKYHGYSKRINL